MQCFTSFYLRAFMEKSVITRTVLFLSLISLFNDMGSELLYPVMPVFLSSIGFSAVMIGVLEGIAEAVSGLSKGYFGQLSDVTGRRARYVQAGYAMSALAKPVMAIFTFPFWIFFARTLDRFGKGVREAPRDAMLNAEAEPDTKGRIFGFHRALDTTGAVFGPLIALGFLYFFPAQYRTLFLLAFIPGAATVFLTLRLKDKNSVTVLKEKTSFFSFLKCWEKSSPAYRRLMIGLLFFALINSSDFFLLLKMKAAGISDVMVIGAYIFYNTIYALLSYPLGKMGDRLGLKIVFVMGMLLFTLVYGGFAYNKDHISAFFLLLVVYGIFAAATEGIAKAWICTTCPTEETGTAIGTFTAFKSICTMIASSMCGLIWVKFGAEAALYTSAVGAFVTAIYLWGIGIE